MLEINWTFYDFKVYFMKKLKQLAEETSNNIIQLAIFGSIILWFIIFLVFYKYIIIYEIFFLLTGLVFSLCYITKSEYSFIWYFIFIGIV